MSSLPARILVLSDDAGFATSLEKTLTRSGYVVRVSPFAVFAADPVKFDDWRFDLLLVDVGERIGEGMRLSQRIRNFCPACTVLLVSALDRDEWESLLVGRGGATLLEKPVKRETLLATVEELILSKAERDRADVTGSAGNGWGGAVT